MSTTVTITVTTNSKGSTVVRTCDGCNKSETSPFSTPWLQITSNASGEHKAQDLCCLECVGTAHGKAVTETKRAVIDRDAAIAVAVAAAAAKAKAEADAAAATERGPQ